MTGRQAMLWIVLWGSTAPYLAAVAADVETAEPGTLVFSLRRWEGEYATRDIAGGVTATPVVGSIHTIRADGADLEKVVELGRNTDNPMFSPDGRWIYFQSSATGRSQVYRCRPDGSGVVNLTARNPLGPAWQEAFGYFISTDGR